jgi:hypothetical protein
VFRSFKQGQASLRFLKLFDNKVAFRRDDVAAESGANHFADALRDTGFPIHEGV